MNLGKKIIATLASITLITPFVLKQAVPVHAEVVNLPKDTTIKIEIKEADKDNAEIDVSMKYEGSEDTNVTFAITGVHYEPHEWTVTQPGGLVGNDENSINGQDHGVFIGSWQDVKKGGEGTLKARFKKSELQDGKTFNGQIVFHGWNGRLEISDYETMADMVSPQEFIDWNGNPISFAIELNGPAFKITNEEAAIEEPAQTAQPQESSAPSESSKPEVKETKQSNNSSTIWMGIGIGAIVAVAAVYFTKKKK